MSQRRTARDHRARARVAFGICVVLGLSVASLRWPGLQLVAMGLAGLLVAVAWKRMVRESQPGYTQTKRGRRSRWELQDDYVALARSHGYVMARRDEVLDQVQGMESRARLLEADNQGLRIRLGQAESELQALARWVGSRFGLTTATRVWALWLGRMTPYAKSVAESILAASEEHHGPQAGPKRKAGR